MPTVASSLRNNILNCTNQENAFKMIADSNYAGPTKGSLRWMWKKKHLGTTNQPKKTDETNENDKVMKFQEQLMDVSEEKMAMEMITKSDLSRSTKCRLRKLWKEKYSKSKTKSKRSTTKKKAQPMETTPTEIESQECESVSLVVAENVQETGNVSPSPPQTCVSQPVNFINYIMLRRDMLLYELNQLNTIISQHYNSQSTTVCMICSKDPQGYDLKCGHPMCYECLHKSGFKATCKICGNTESYTNEDYDHEEEDDPVADETN